MNNNLPENLNDLDTLSRKELCEKLCTIARVNLEANRDTNNRINSLVELLQQLSDEANVIAKLGKTKFGCGDIVERSVKLSQDLKYLSTLGEPVNHEVYHIAKYALEGVKAYAEGLPEEGVVDPSPEILAELSKVAEKVKEIPTKEVATQLFSLFEIQKEGASTQRKLFASLASTQKSIIEALRSGGVESIDTVIPHLEFAQEALDTLSRPDVVTEQTLSAVINQLKSMANKD